MIIVFSQIKWEIIKHLTGCLIYNRTNARMMLLQAVCLRSQLRGLQRHLQTELSPSVSGLSSTCPLKTQTVWRVWPNSWIFILHNPFVCVRMEVHMYVCGNSHMDASVDFRCLSCRSPPDFVRDMVSHRTKCLLIQLDWLPSSPPKDPPVSAPPHRDYSRVPHVQHSCGCWGPKCKSSCFCSKCFIH